MPDCVTHPPAPGLILLRRRIPLRARVRLKGDARLLRHQRRLESLQSATMASVRRVNRIRVGQFEALWIGSLADSPDSRLPAILRLLCIRRSALTPENLCLRKHLALFQERKPQPRSTPASTRLFLSALARFTDWREAPVILKPATVIGWHQATFRTFWHGMSRKPGRHPFRVADGPRTQSMAVSRSPG